jgi:hypothetical protein
MPFVDRTWMVVRALALGCAVSAVAACATPSSAKESAGESAQAQEPKVIQHQVPRRDFVGRQPDRFVWTAVPEADHYAIGLWNEVDRLLWRQDGISGTSVDRPAELDLDEGTYFWLVSGLRDGQEIAKSGLAAFVVEK